MKFSVFDQHCMKLALSEAMKAYGKTFPNPVVGAVLAKDGKILSTGYHYEAGKDHAEIDALKKIGWPKNKKAAEGVTLYVTLEPCAFFGRTPPCADTLVNAGIQRIVFSMKDPHDPDGKSRKLFNKNKIEFQFGLFEKEARMQNQIFLKNVLQKKPYVVSKVAITLDGKIASSIGDSRGISSQESLQKVHQLRSESQAILVGANTVLKDNPHLGVRYAKGQDPIRIILDRKLRSPPDALVFRNSRVIVFVGNEASKNKKKLFQKKGIEIIELSNVTPQKVLDELFQRNIFSILVEGGSKILTSFWEFGYIDRYFTCITPKLAGGALAQTSLSGKGKRYVKQFDILKNVSVQQCGPDVWVDGYLKIY